MVSIVSGPRNWHYGRKILYVLKMHIICNFSSSNSTFKMFKQGVIWTGAVKINFNMSRLEIYSIYAKVKTIYYSYIVIILQISTKLSVFTKPKYWHCFCQPAGQAKAKGSAFIANPRQWLRPKQCLGGFIFTLSINK